jgi:nitroreductase
MVRNFEARPVPPQVVERLVANARRGPSAGFTQGVELLVLDGPEQTAAYWDVSLPDVRRDRFRWNGLLRAPLLILVFCSKQAYVERYAEPDKGIPAVDQRWATPFWHVDGAFAAMLVLLSAVDAGLGALFFAVFHPDAVRRAFGVPEAYEPVGVIAVGYPLPDEPSPSLARGHRPVEEVVHRGRW